MPRTVDIEQLKRGGDLIKRGFARMQQGGVIMDVVNAEQAAIAEDSGAVAVMALERVPADIRADGGVARMSHPDMIQEIMDVTSIPVMAKTRIGHDAEARILESLGVDMVDESEVLTPADPFFHIDKRKFEIPFVCGATELGEAVRRILEGAAMIRTKGEAGTGNIVAAVTHARLISKEVEVVQDVQTELDIVAEHILRKYEVLNNRVNQQIGIRSVATPFGSITELRDSIRQILEQIRLVGRLPVVTFSAGGIATPADAALMMEHGMDGIFVGSGIFKSEDPSTIARAIVEATHHFDNPETVAEACRMSGTPMRGIELETLAPSERLENRGC